MEEVDVRRSGCRRAQTRRIQCLMHGRCSVKLVVSLALLVIYQAPEPLRISGPDDSARGEFIGLGPLFLVPLHTAVASRPGRARS